MYISSASAAVMPLQLDEKKAANSEILHTHTYKNTSQKNVTFTNHLRGHFGNAA